MKIPLVYNSIPSLMKRLREILANEYIGAIAIGFLLFQVFATLISTILQPIATYIETRSRPQSLFAPAHSIFNWPQIVLSITSMVLHLLVAFLLTYWLYFKKEPEPVTAGPTGNGPVVAEGAPSTSKPEEPS